MRMPRVAVQEVREARKTRVIASFPGGGKRGKSSKPGGLDCEKRSQSGQNVKALENGTLVLLMKDCSIHTSSLFLVFVEALTRGMAAPPKSSPVVVS